MTIEKKTREQILEELQTKSLDYRLGFIEGMLWTQATFNKVFTVDKENVA